MQIINKNYLFFSPLHTPPTHAFIDHLLRTWSSRCAIASFVCRFFQGWINIQIIVFFLVHSRNYGWPGKLCIVKSRVIYVFFSLDISDGFSLSAGIGSNGDDDDGATPCVEYDYNISEKWHSLAISFTTRSPTLITLLQAICHTPTLTEPNNHQL